jgi:hypothetical protein
MSRIKVLSTDQLVVTSCVIQYTGSGPILWRLIFQLNMVSALEGPLVGVLIETIGKTQALRPDAGIDDTDHNSFAGLIGAAKLLPKTLLCIKAKETGG